jgi:hypothetical protein
MSEDWMSNAVSEVLVDLSEERSRTRAGFELENRNNGPVQPPRAQGDSRWQTRDPDNLQPEADFGNIWRMLPALKDIPEEMLRTLPLSTVLQLNDALSRELRPKKLMDADAKLQHNAETLAANPTKVEAGLDDRGSTLHQPDSWEVQVAVPSASG